MTAEPGAFRSGQRATTAQPPAAVPKPQTNAFDDLLNRLAFQRGIVNNDVSACCDVAHTRQRLTNRRANAKRFHDRYIAALSQLRRYQRDDLQAALDDTTARLERGWVMEGNAVDDLFERLVLHVEVLTDALTDPDKLRRTHHERLARIGA